VGSGGIPARYSARTLPQRRAKYAKVFDKPLSRDYSSSSRTNNPR
jgi:hypothetical protein